MMIFGYFLMEKVVIDLGGIHQALSETTDLWDALEFKEGVGATKDDDKKKHTG